MNTILLKYPKYGLNNMWKEKISIMTHAFQPIVSIHSGAVLGFEALLRNTDQAGFNSIDEVFNLAAKEKVLFALDMELRKKAILKFKKIENSFNTKLFYNIDNRIIEMPDYKVGMTKRVIEENNLKSESFTFEISEKYNFNDQSKIKNILYLYKKQGYNVALDDFGSGYSGLKYFYNFEPNFIKIDRFFIKDISNIERKKVIVEGLVKIAKKLGMKTIAEGVETKEEFLLCKDMGCDYVQGYLIQEPQTDISKLSMNYEIVKSLNLENRRKNFSDKSLISKNLEFVFPVYSYTSVMDLFEKIKKTKETNVIPIVNKQYEPQGVILEKNLREYVYSMYGKDLLLNKSYGKSIIDFITEYPIMDINAKLEKQIEILSNASDNVDFIIITEEDKYKGLLNSKAILKAVNEKNLDFARNMNPLTKLAGNATINDFIKSLSGKDENSFLVYFDFNDFKPFNDKYGFRRGDRAIILFADILREIFNGNENLIGHIGGDDFFVGIKGKIFEDVYNDVTDCVERFRIGVKDLYDDKDKQLGYIVAEDRYGEKRKFNLLTVSGLIIEIPEKSEVDLSTLDNIIPDLKKTAKSTGFVVSSTYNKVG